MNNSTPLGLVVDVLEHVRNGRVLQIEGEPTFSVHAALNVLSGLDTDHRVRVAPLSWSQRLSGVEDITHQQAADEALNWARNEGLIADGIERAAPEVVIGVGGGRVPFVGPVALSTPHQDSAVRTIVAVFEQAAMRQFERGEKFSPLSLDGLATSTLRQWVWDVPRARRGPEELLQRAFARGYAAGLTVLGCGDEARPTLEMYAARSGLLERLVIERVLNTPLANTGLERAVREWASEAFVAHLKTHPTVLEELLPTFGQRLFDLAHGRGVLGLPDGHPLRGALGASQAYLEEKWGGRTGMRGEGLYNTLHQLFDKNALAQQWLAKHDPVLVEHNRRYEGARQQALAHVRTALAPSLGERLERYRSDETARRAGPSL